MRLIDASELVRVLNRIDACSTLRTMRIRSVIDFINGQPTVYDVDKVVEQLEYEKEFSFADFERYAEEVDPRLDTEYDDFFYCGIKRAIQIIKAGVDTEINHGKEVYLKALEDYHRLISEECKSMLIDFNPYAFHLKKYNDEVLERLKAGGKNE